LVEFIKALVEIIFNSPFIQATLWFGIISQVVQI